MEYIEQGSMNCSVTAISLLHIKHDTVGSNAIITDSNDWLYDELKNYKCLN
jgi:hypothetical protein